MSKRVYYNRTNTCDRCIEKGIETKLVKGKTLRECDKEGNWTGKWLCNKCYMTYDYHKRPGCGNNIQKLLTSCRTGNQNSNCSTAKGDNFEELTSIWKGVKILSKENDEYCGPLDHSADSEGIIYQTKGKWYDSYNQRWSQCFENEHNTIFNGFEFDVLILYCASKDGEIIERIYIIPLEETMKRTGITVYKNPTDRWSNPITPWYEQYRIKDEEIINKINKIWNKI